MGVGGISWLGCSQCWLSKQLFLIMAGILPLPVGLSWVPLVYPSCDVAVVELFSKKDRKYFVCVSTETIIV